MSRGLRLPADAVEMAKNGKWTMKQKAAARSAGIKLVTIPIDTAVKMVNVWAIPYPPTVNNYFTVAHGRKILSKRAREYRKAVAAVVLNGVGQKPFGTKRLHVKIELFPPDLRRRDLDNVTKAVFDALQSAGLYEDDSQIDFFSVERKPKVDGGSCVVSIEEMK